MNNPIIFFKPNYTFQNQKNMTISQFIKHLREQHGISQSELARLSGLSRAGVHLLETGQREPNLATLMRLLSVFDGKVFIRVGDQETIINQ
jgi:transcriptional regulator with XRE-family HTH domain